MSSDRTISSEPCVDDDGNTVPTRAKWRSLSSARRCVSQKVLDAADGFIDVVKLLLSPRRSPCPRAHRLLPLRSRFRNHATCPWKELPRRFSATHARRCCRESDGVGGSRVASPPDLLCRAGRSSDLEF